MPLPGMELTFIRIYRMDRRSMDNPRSLWIWRQELEGPAAHSLSNILTLDDTLRDMFDSLELSLEAVPGKVHPSLHYEYTGRNTLTPRRFTTPLYERGCPRSKTRRNSLSTTASSLASRRQTQRACLGPTRNTSRSTTRAARSPTCQGSPPTSTGWRTSSNACASLQRTTGPQTLSPTL